MNCQRNVGEWFELKGRLLQAKRSGIYVGTPSAPPRERSDVVTVPPGGKAQSISGRSTYLNSTLHNTYLVGDWYHVGGRMDISFNTQPRGPFAGKTLVFTGTLQHQTREEAKAHAESLGAKVSGTVSKKTDYVIAGKNCGSSKERVAKLLGLPVLGERTWRERAGLPAKPKRVNVTFDIETMNAADRGTAFYKEMKAYFRADAAIVRAGEDLKAGDVVFTLKTGGEDVVERDEQGHPVVRKSPERTYVFPDVKLKDVKITTGKPKPKVEFKIVNNLDDTILDSLKNKETFQRWVHHRPRQSGKTFEQSLLDQMATSLGVSYEQLSREYPPFTYSAMREAQNRINRHSTYGKFRSPDRCIYWDAFYSGALGEPFIPINPTKEKTMTDTTVIPAFVEPERPSAPKSPVDTPSAAALRPLLADREALVKRYEARMKIQQQHIDDFKATVLEHEEIRDHAEASRAKAAQEVAEIRENIDRLNGVSAPAQR